MACTSDDKREDSPINNMTMPYYSRLQHGESRLKDRRPCGVLAASVNALVPGRSKAAMSKALTENGAWWNREIRQMRKEVARLIFSSSFFSFRNLYPDLSTLKRVASLYQVRITNLRALQTQGWSRRKASWKEYLFPDLICFHIVHAALAIN